MTEKSKQTGLCTNCLNGGHCFYQNNKKEPVHFCEEYTCTDAAVSVEDLKRRETAQALFLPRSQPGLFDDCGKPAPQGS